MIVWKIFPERNNRLKIEPVVLLLEDIFTDQTAQMLSLSPLAD